MKIPANLDKIGTLGLFLVALLSPCCFPLFGFLLAAFGLGSAELFSHYTPYIFQGLVIVSLLGNYISYRQHRNFYPLLLAAIGGGLIFYAYMVHFNQSIVYAGMVGLLVSAGLNYYWSRKYAVTCSCCVIEEGKKVELHSTITCPHCGYQKAEQMPTNACQFFYPCEGCHTTLKPKKGDCCVFCSYGTVVCPPKQ